MPEGTTVMANVGLKEPAKRSGSCCSDPPLPAISSRPPRRAIRREPAPALPAMGPSFLAPHPSRLSPSRLPARGSVCLQPNERLGPEPGLMPQKRQRPRFYERKDRTAAAVSGSSNHTKTPFIARVRRIRYACLTFSRSALTTTSSGLLATLARLK